jgi:phage gp29-like protein
MPFVWVMGKKTDLGLLLACSMYAVYKRGNFGDWAQYVEIFGQPVRIIYYDAYDTKTKTELKDLLDNSGSSLALMIPKQAQFEMLDGKTSNGDGKLQDSFKNACNDEMAICILGNTETTSSSKSSGYAQSKEHGEQQDEITASDLIFVENMLNSVHFINILKSYGYKVEGGAFAYELDLNLANLKLRMEIDTFVSTKVPIGDEYWYHTYGIPKPDNYDELKKRMTESVEKGNVEEVKKEDPKKQDHNTKKLTDSKKQNLLDLVFKNLADFFDQAQP